MIDVSNLRIFYICAIAMLLSAIVPFTSVYADENQQLQIEIRYTNGDRISTYQAEYVVYQDNEKTPFIEKELEINPDTLYLPQNHEYRVEVFVNGIFSEMKKIELNEQSEKLQINIPLSGGIKFNVFYEDGETPLEGSTIVIKSHNGQEQRRGVIDTQGDSMRYWLQSTNYESEHYTAEIYFEDFLLHTVSNIKIQQAMEQDLKITIPVPAVVEELLVFQLYDSELNKISKSDGIYSISLMDKNDVSIAESEISARGLVYFSNIPSGIYKVLVMKDGEHASLWDDIEIAIIGNQNEFELIQTPVSEPVSEGFFPTFVEPITYDSTSEEYYLTCNCVAFRLDDIQDYWLTDVQVELLDLFSEKEIPLTVGIIANDFGNDAKIVDAVKNQLADNRISIANHGLVHNPFTNYDKQEQNEMIVEANKKIHELLNVNPKIFIPPENKFNKDTKEVLIENGFTHLSAALFSDSPPFLLEQKSFYRFPQMAETGGYVPSQNRIVGVSADETFSDTMTGLNEHGLAVITLHPQEFAVFEGGQYVNEVNQEQIDELSSLIEKIQSQNISIIFLEDIQYNMFKVTSENQVISSESYTIPKWIKNNAGWWRDGFLDDESFVQGIQFLITEGIMEIPPTTQGVGGTEIPQWVKTNAGWWAENRISDDDFVNGITYLVNQGIMVV